MTTQGFLLFYIFTVIMRENNQNISVERYSRMVSKARYFCIHVFLVIKET